MSRAAQRRRVRRYLHENKLVFMVVGAHRHEDRFVFERIGEDNRRNSEHTKIVDGIIDEVSKRRGYLNDDDRAALDECCNLLMSMPMDTGRAVEAISKAMRLT